MNAPVESVERAVGRRARQLREESGITLDQFATRAREHGLRWTTARVIEFEKGQTRLTLSVLLVVAQALGGLRGTPVHLRELVPMDAEWLRLTDEWLVRPARLVAALEGQPVELGSLTAVSHGPTAVPEEALKPTLAETRAAKRLGVRPRQVAMWAHMLWGWHLDDQVRSLAGVGSNAQKLGHISRELVAEIGQQIAAHSEGGAPDGTTTDTDR